MQCRLSIAHSFFRINASGIGGHGRGCLRQRLIEIPRSHLVPGFLREAECRGPRDPEAPVEYQNAILDQGRWPDLLNWRYGLRASEPNSNPLRVPTLMSTGPSMTGGISTCLSTQSVSAVIRGLQGIP